MVFKTLAPTQIEEAEAPKKILDILRSSTSGTISVMAVVSLKDNEAIIGKKGWNSQLLEAAGGDKKKLLDYLHDVICDYEQDKNLRKAAAFFYGINITAEPGFDFNKEGLLQQAGKKFVPNEINLQRMLREIFGFADINDPAMGDEMVHACSNAIMLMFNAGYFSAEKKKGEPFVLNTTFPYDAFVSQNEQVLTGGTYGQVPNEYRPRFNLLPPALSIKTDVYFVPGNINLPAGGGAYGCKDLYIAPYASLIGGTLNQNASVGNYAIIVNNLVPVPHFNDRMTTIANQYVDHEVTVATPTGDQSWSVRRLIMEGDPSANYNQTQLILASGQSVEDAYAKAYQYLVDGRVDLFINSLKKGSPLRQAFGTTGDATAKSYALNLGLSELYANLTKSTSINVGGSVPLFDNARLYVYVLQQKNTYTPTLYLSNAPISSEESSSISTTTMSTRLVGAIYPVSISMKPVKVVPRYLVGASVSKTKVGESLRDMVQEGGFDFSIEAGGGASTVLDFGKRVKKNLEFGADLLSRVSIGGHDPRYDLQITPSISFGIGNKNTTRFTVYSDILMLDAQKGASIHKSLPNTQSGVSASYEFMVPSSKVVKGVELKLDANTKPFEQGVQDVQFKNAFKNFDWNKTSVQFGLTVHFR